MKDYGLDGLIGPALISGRDRIQVPPSLDRRVLESSSTVRSLPAVPVIPVLGSLVLLFCVASFVFINTDGSKRDCLALYADLAEAMGSKDVERSLSCFDMAAMGTDRNSFKDNFSGLFEKAEGIRYEFKDVEVKSGPKGAVATGRHLMTVTLADGRTLTSSGKDRVWFTRTASGMKILYWLTEKENTYQGGKI